MRIQKHSLKCAICLFMTLVLVFGMMLCTSAVDADLAGTGAENDVAQTGISGTVYFKNTANWSSVNAYVWIKNTNTSVQAWPGQSMTLFKDNVYKYTVTGDYNMIIFSNNGANQTVDLSIPGDGQIYDFSTGTWSEYPDHVPGPTTNEPTQAPTSAPTQSGESKMVYCKNSAGWASVSAYMWINGTETSNQGWPGKAMTNIGDDVWQYEVTGNWDMIIFNNGSSAAQTGNLQFPGNGYIYDNKTGEWGIYDTSDIRVSSFGTDLSAPQYKGTDITLTTDATSSNGAVYYKFSVTFNGATTVLSDYTTKNSAVWTPTASGTYTLTYDYKDVKGVENQRTAQYEVADDAGIEEPILKGVSPKPGQVKKGTPISFKANASGGNVGTNLLFYKFTVKDEVGNIVNVPYYTKNASYNFTPSALGTYTVTVSVQASNNKLIERTFTYTSVNEITDDPTPTLPTEKPTTGSYLRGDSDMDGEITIIDATGVQRYVAQFRDHVFSFENGDADLDGEVTIIDASMIQKKVAQMDVW